MRRTKTINGWFHVILITVFVSSFFVVSGAGIAGAWDWPWAGKTAKFIVCPRCGGLGKVQRQVNMPAMVELDKDGSGFIMPAPSFVSEKECEACEGTGKIKSPLD